MLYPGADPCASDMNYGIPNFQPIFPESSCLTTVIEREVLADGKPDLALVGQYLHLCLAESCLHLSTVQLHQPVSLGHISRDGLVALVPPKIKRWLSF